MKLHDGVWHFFHFLEFQHPLADFAFCKRIALTCMRCNNVFRKWLITAKVDKEKYEDAKKKIFSDLSTDEKVHGDPEAQKYTVMNLPTGCDKHQFRRAQGDQGWLSCSMAKRQWTLGYAILSPQRSSSL